MNRNLATLIVAILFIAGVIFYGSRTARHAQQNGVSSVSGDKISADAAKGKQAPDFTLTSLEGKPVKLSDYRGKAVVLNFWATWCGPCKVEMPWLIDLQNKYRPQGLEIVGVSMDDGNQEGVAKFTKEMGVNYTVLTVNDKVKDQLDDAYGGLVGLPTTFYIDSTGKIVEANAGLLSKSEIEDNMKKTIESAGVTKS